MGRPLRLEFSGALYHVTSRGNRKEEIYESDDDRVLFLDIFSEVCKSYSWICYRFLFDDKPLAYFDRNPRREPIAGYASAKWCI